MYLLNERSLKKVLDVRYHQDILSQIKVFLPR